MVPFWELAGELGSAPQQCLSMILGTPPHGDALEAATMAFSSLYLLLRDLITVAERDTPVLPPHLSPEHDGGLEWETKQQGDSGSGSTGCD